MVAETIHLQCDQCHSWSKAFSQVDRLQGLGLEALKDHIRYKCRRAGWSTDGRDLCPKCHRIEANFREARR